MTAANQNRRASDPYACPACGADLVRAQPAWRCAGCSREYVVVAGIPDLRHSYEDPYVSREEDVARARELEAMFDSRDLLGLLEEHWRRSGKPPELAKRFLAGDRVAAARSASYLDSIEEHRGATLDAADRVLEVGCGTAALAVAAAERTGSAIATDISMRWLVLAKKRLAELGIDSVELVCCNAEDPPFRAGAFSLVVAGDVIEHVADQRRFSEACARILEPGGVLFLATPNRFSLSLEPHVRLWGVGYLPRRLARRYVQAARHAPYDHVRLLSSRALRRILRASGVDPVIEAPGIPAATRVTYTGLEGWLIDLYNRVQRHGVAQRLLLRVGPFFHVFATKGKP
ncbi:MAG TPA: class I SAM-dependent methyltransferase [Thermoleophilaceae bacterium]|nr:class I SAM-dependent methyltransferase [Thermoleophilaceae bacterium]